MTETVAGFTPEQMSVVRVLEERRAEIRDKLLDRLETIAAGIRAGNISSFAVATVEPDLSTGNLFMLGDKTFAELLGSVRLLEHRMLTAGEQGPLE